jgi:hypothetical protein
MAKRKSKSEAPAPTPTPLVKTRKAIVVMEGCSLTFRGGLRDAGEEIKPHEQAHIADIDSLMDKVLEEVEKEL